MKALGYDGLAAMLRSAADRVEAEHQQLSKLDAAIGDGDHGTTMRRVSKAITQSVADNSERTPRALLETVGWAVMGVDGGSTGPLLGSLLMGMSEAADVPELSPADVAAVFEAGLAKVRAQTPAQVGDKTMMDALVPAVLAIRIAADDGKDVRSAMTLAAAAADAGARSTTDLQAKFGRARNLGARTVGHVDPGATSITLIFAAFRDALT